MNRYWLLIFPLFFARGALLKARPLALALWVVVSVWTYWNVVLCGHIGQWSTQACGF